MKIAVNIVIASDHVGFDLKQEILKFFSTSKLYSKTYSFTDLGAFSHEPVDYPDYVTPVCDAVLKKKANYGILICGTGVGMSIAANRFHGIRAALCESVAVAKQSREHLDANVLVLGQKQIKKDVVLDITSVFLSTPFTNEERHVRRMNKIDGLCCEC